MVRRYQKYQKAYAEGYPLVIQKSRVCNIPGSFAIYHAPWTMASIPISIPSSLRSGMSDLAILRSNTRAKIGNQRIIHKTKIAFSQLSLVEFGKRKNEKAQRAKNIMKYPTYFRCFFNKASRGARKLLMRGMIFIESKIVLRENIVWVNILKPKSKCKSSDTSELKSFKNFGSRFVIESGSK